MWTIQGIYNRWTSWDQITGCVAEGETKDNIQDYASGNFMMMILAQEHTGRDLGGRLDQC